MDRLYIAIRELSSGFSGKRVPVEVIEKKVQVKLPSEDITLGLKIKFLDDYVFADDILVPQGEERYAIPLGYNFLTFKQVRDEKEVYCYVLPNLNNLQDKKMAALYSRKSN